MPKQEGVYRDSKGRWYFKVAGGRDPLTGKRIQVTRRGFATATDAARARRVFLEAANAGHLSPAPGSLTVDGLMDEYLDGLDADSRLSPKTRFDYATATRVTGPSRLTA